MELLLGRDLAVIFALVTLLVIVMAALRATHRPHSGRSKGMHR